MAQGSLSLVLHAHLPWVRDPDRAGSLEEDWLYEALTETYLPLLRMMDALEADGVPWRLTLSVSPTLVAMLEDPLLRERASARLAGLVEVARREAARRAGGPFEEAAAFYVQELAALQEAWEGRYRRELLAGLRRHEEAGRLCLMSAAGTHALLPLMATEASRRAHVAEACRLHERHVGRRPDGLWLPECAWAPGLDRILADEGVRFTLLDTHGVSHARPRPRLGHARPLWTPAGVAVFGRDPEASRQIWSATEGYPGDPLYREFYRDAGWDAPDDVVEPVLGGGPRRAIGLKMHRVTGPVGLDDKEPYVPSWARDCAAVHAEAFLARRGRDVVALGDALGLEPHLAAPFDAELFGHWWFEGPRFLEALFRAADRQDALALTTPRHWLAAHPEAQVAEPAASTWGDGGTLDVWMNGENAWIYRHLHRAEEALAALARRAAARADGAGPAPGSVEDRALRQAARELMLAQASDWAFALTMRTVVPAATRRTREHLDRFEALAAGLRAGAVDEALLADLEARDGLFPGLDWRVWARGPEGAGAGGAVTSAGRG